MNNIKATQKIDIVKLEELALKYHWCYLAPNVYRDKFGNNILYNSNLSISYYTTLCNGSVMFFDINEFIQYYEKPVEYRKLCDDLHYELILYNLVCDDSTNTFTPLGFINICNVSNLINSTIYKILEKYRKHFYFREVLTDIGTLNIWVYTTKKQYLDHSRYILNNQKRKLK